MFGPGSGRHTRVVSLVDTARSGGLARRTCCPTAAAQVGGCIAGAVLINPIYGLAAVSVSDTHRSTPAHLLAEVVAIVALLLVIFAVARTRRAATAPAAVGACIGAAYWFTSSTSFANPAITVGR